MKPGRGSGRLRRAPGAKGRNRAGKKWVGLRPLLFSGWRAVPDTRRAVGPTPGPGPAGPRFSPPSMRFSFPVSLSPPLSLSETSLKKNKIKQRGSGWGRPGDHDSFGAQRE